MTEINSVSALGTALEVAQVRKFPLVVFLRAKIGPEILAELYISRHVGQEDAAVAMYRAFDDINLFIDFDEVRGRVGEFAKICRQLYGDVVFSVIIRNRNGD
jgi:hypothetical protein